jgi:HSP20 family protein
MVETSLQMDTRAGWYAPDEVQYLGPDGVRWRIVARPHVWRPPTDVYETEEAIFVRVEIAGARENEIAITIEGQLLSIRGVRTDISERRAYYQMEIPFGEFSTEIDLPSPVVKDQIEASYRDGFLKIVLPKVQPHQIRIKD